MKKSEILALCLENNVKPSNIASFLKSTKKRQELLPRIDKIRTWLTEQERKAYRENIEHAKKMKAKKFGFSVKEMVHLENKARDILKDFRSEYNMGDYRTLEINGEAFATAHDIAFYKGYYKGKGRETHGSIVIDLSKKEIRSIERLNGLWTVTLENNRAKWLATSGKYRDFSVDFRPGFLLGESHGLSLEEAQAYETRKQIARHLQAMNDKAFVGIEHIRKTGACEAGIKAYIDRHGLNPELGYNLGYLKSLENSPYLKRTF